jgi:hypothetical protein
MRWLIVLTLLAAGCSGAAAPRPVIDEFAREVVRVRVPYAPGGPQSDQAQAAADEVAQRFCDSYGRKAAFASLFREKPNLIGRGVFTSCTGAQVDVVPSAAVLSRLQPSIG